MKKIPSFSTTTGVALYIHWPFCEKKCNYCDFVSGPQYKGQEEAYVNALLVELSSYEPFPIRTLYIGGGTPSLMPLHLLNRIFNSLLPWFSLASQEELTLEGNPGSLMEENLRHYLRLGINRLSIGVQSFSNRLLKELGRIHTRQEAIESFLLARKTGFKNINIDLMFGIPSQRIEDFQESLETAVQLGPDHISTYSLILEPGTPFFERYHEEQLPLPEEHQVIEMFLWAQEYLKGHGYRHYEISNFAREGFECRHNLVYWENDPYVGLGLNAHSYYGNKRYSNTPNIQEYLQGPTATTKNWHKFPQLPLDEEISNFMILGLRKTDGVTFSHFSQRYGGDLKETFKDEIQWLSLRGLVKVDDRGLSLTPKGILLGNEVFEKFL